MKEIKRLDVYGIARKFGMDLQSKDFVFKPKEMVIADHHDPHRSEMYGFGILLKGSTEFIVGLERHSAQAPGLVVISPDEIRQWVYPQNKLVISSIFFSENFIVEGLSDTFFLKKLNIFKRECNHFIPLKPAELISIQTLFDQIEKIYTSDSTTSYIIIQALVRTVLLMGEEIQQIQPTFNSDKFTQAHQLALKFKGLLAACFSEQREVAYFADHLCVTPKYLSQVLKEQTGKTAGELIDEIVCLEAKVLLQVTVFNVSQIADQLNFANPSSFGKFFKRQAGVSPMIYRKIFLTQK